MQKCISNTLRNYLALYLDLNVFQKCRLSIYSAQGEMLLYCLYRLMKYIFATRQFWGTYIVIILSLYTLVVVNDKASVCPEINFNVLALETISRVSVNFFPLLNPFVPNAPFSTPWKHQKTVRLNKWVKRAHFFSGSCLWIYMWKIS